MPVLMFWNVARKSQFPHLGIAAEENDVDIVILAECEDDDSKIIRDLNAKGPSRPYSQVMGGVRPLHGVPSLKFFSRLPDHSMHPVYDSGRISIRSITPPLGPDFLLVAAHLRSKSNADDDDQHAAAVQLKNEIISAERQAQHSRTIVIGDLNMDPFDKGMFSSNGLHAIMDKSVAINRKRIVMGESCDYFYNPMWSRMGDESLGPPGTYYFNRSGHVMNRFWSTFDQVLLRPDLLPYYRKEQLNVLQNIGMTSLMKLDTIDISISDHLPLVINLQTEKFCQ